MEKDDEVSGNGNSYTTQFRQYDPRLGRWKSLDPLAHILINKSPYEGLANNPVLYSDNDGDIVKIKNMPRKMRMALIADLRVKTGLEITMNIWGKLEVPPNTPVPPSTDLGALNLYQIILDPGRRFDIAEPARYNFWHPYQKVQDQHMEISNPGNLPNPTGDPTWADAPGATYQIFLSQSQFDDAILSDPGDPNLKSCTSIGAIFFHEAIGHAKLGLLDEPLMQPAAFYNVEVATGNGAGGAPPNIAGSAANYENMIFQSMGCPMMRRNYAVVLGEYAYIFYSEHKIEGGAKTQINLVITNYNDGTVDENNITRGTQLSYYRVWVPRLAAIERMKDLSQPSSGVSSKVIKKAAKKVESSRPRYD